MQIVQKIHQHSRRARLAQYAAHPARESSEINECATKGEGTSLIRVATEAPVDFATGVTSAVLSATTFITVLWTIGGSLTSTIAGAAITIPGFLVIVAVIYAVLVSGSMVLIGHGHLRSPRIFPKAVEGPGCRINKLTPRAHRGRYPLHIRCSLSAGKIGNNFIIGQSAICDVCPFTRI